MDRVDRRGCDRATRRRACHTRSTALASAYTHRSPDLLFESRRREGGTRVRSIDAPLLRDHFEEMSGAELTRGLARWSLWSGAPRISTTQWAPVHRIHGDACGLLDRVDSLPHHAALVRNPRLHHSFHYRRSIIHEVTYEKQPAGIGGPGRSPYVRVACADVSRVGTSARRDRDRASSEPCCRAWRTLRRLRDATGTLPSSAPRMRPRYLSSGGASPRSARTSCPFGMTAACRRRAALGEPAPE